MVLFVPEMLRHCSSLREVLGVLAWNTLEADTEFI